MAPQMMIQETIFTDQLCVSLTGDAFSTNGPLH